MLLKRIWIFLLCGVIAAGLVDYAVTFRFFDRPLTQAKQEEFQEQIKLPDNFTLAASVDTVDTVKNTLQAAKKSVYDGTYALELNVTINSKGVPYLADIWPTARNTSPALRCSWKPYSRPLPTWNTCAIS